MEDLYLADDISGDSVELTGEESKHCVRVKRHVVGDLIALFDGKGTVVSARLESIGKESCRALVLDRSTPVRPAPLITIAVAATKSPSRMEWFAEKATELGVAQITMITCARSERTSLRVERLRKIILAAAKQSHNLWLPSLSMNVDYKQVVEADAGQKFIATQSSNISLHKAYTKSSDVIVLIGPEGDFTDEEMSMAMKKGFTQVNLGTSRLRTETAALAACHTLTLTHD